MIYLKENYQELLISELPQDCIDACSAPGPVDAAVNHWREELDFQVDRELAIECLLKSGAWEREELVALADSELADKVLWLACCDFSEFQTNPKYGCDFFTLGE